MISAPKKRDSLLNKLKNHSCFLKGSLNDYCAKCNRAKCICKQKTKLRSYRLTYKDHDNKTKVIYVPRERVKEVKDMLLNYKKIRNILDQILTLNIDQFKNSG